MFHPLTRLLSILLALVVVLATTTQLTAQLAHVTATRMELCADAGAGGAQVVWLDAKGNPLPSHVHDCPDCLVLAVLALPQQFQDAPRPDGLGRAARQVLQIPSQLGPVLSATLARAPPSLV